MGATQVAAKHTHTHTHTTSFREGASHPAVRKGVRKGGNPPPQKKTPKKKDVSHQKLAAYRASWFLNAKLLRGPHSQSKKNAG